MTSDTRELDGCRPERVLVLDFGSDITPLIARNVTASGLGAEIWGNCAPGQAIADWKPAAVILSGGPASVMDPASPRAPDAVWNLGVPVLGICYGEQLMCVQLGGAVGDHRQDEYGLAPLEITGACALFDGLWPVGSTEQVWMSHGDHVTRMAPGFRAVASSAGAPFAAIADDVRRFYGVQFHPEDARTENGAALIRNFTHRVAKLGCL